MPEEDDPYPVKPRIKQDGQESFNGSIDRETSENQILVLIIPEKNYMEKVVSVVKDLNKLSGPICYVSLNRPYKSLKTIFEKNGIDSKNMHFIDGITRTAMTPEPIEQCEYISSPGALTELSVAISQLMDSGKVVNLVFDSLSTLLVYEPDTTIAKFVHFLMAKVRVAGCNAIFTCLKQDADSILVKDINMFADKVINLEKWNTEA